MKRQKAPANFPPTQKIQNLEITKFCKSCEQATKIIFFNQPLQSEPVQKMINAGDMEQLAMLVLNGEGKSLIGKNSTQPDIQAFIDNIPTYMASLTLFISMNNT